MQIFHDNIAWRNKKHNVVLGLLDIALFLIVARQINLEDLLFQDDNYILSMVMDVDVMNGPVTGLINNHIYIESNRDEIYNSKMSSPQFDILPFSYENEIDQTGRINYQTENDTLNKFTDREVNTVMVLQLPQDVQSPIQTVPTENANTTNLNEQLYFPMRELFDVTSNMENDVADTLTNEMGQIDEQHFDNVEEVQWRDFVVNSSETSHADSIILKHDNSMEFFGFEQDVEFFNNIQSNSSNDNTRLRTTSVLSDESGIELEEYCQTYNNAPSHCNLSLCTKQTGDIMHNMKCVAMDNSMNNLNIASTSRYSIRMKNLSPDTLADMEQQDTDMMQSIYQQDIDLGFEWQHIFEPRQPVKEINETKSEKTDNQLDLGEFFVDGETGEHIPINLNQKKNLNNNNQQISQNPADPQTQIDFDEYLDMLETSIDTIQPIENTNHNETFMESRNNTVRSLSSLIEPLVNGTTDSTPSAENIWEEIENLSELAGLDLQEHETQDSSNIVLSNVRLSNATIYEPISQQQKEKSYFLSQPNYSNKNELIVETEVDDQPTSSRFMPNYTYPQNNSSPESTTMYGLNAEDGMPMEEDLSPGLTQQENGYLLNNQLNELRHQAVEMKESPLFGVNMMNTSHLAMLPEPGQGFFEQSQNDYVKMMPDMLSENVPANTFGDDNNNLPFLNPQVPCIVPPFLKNNNSVVSIPNTFMGKNALNTVDRRTISESYEESDSGISMEHSPPGFTMFDDSSMQPLLDDRSFCLTEITAINHNHTYNGTPNGIKSKTNKRKKYDGLSHHRESRDEKKARELNIPFTLDEIILSPVEDYNEMLARTPLTPEQHNLIKDIRRRGKNKVAAQNCRKRKIETITGMEDDVDLLRQRKQQLVDEKHDLDDAKDSIKLHYNALYQQIFSSLRDDAGLPYDPTRFSLEQVEGAILLVQRVNNNNERNQINNHSNHQQPMDQDDNHVDYSKVKIEKED